ncbi:MAG: PD-(D/E)XK nuclease family protein, partial [Actinomycetota bacterium]|nr:PD-(D/E)XK nuclease family protein [Actinomycetota bacterium]
MDSDVRLTAEQQSIVDADGDRVVVAGKSGTGKTTTLIARYLRLVADHPASSVLVLCPSRAGAGRFLDAVLPQLAGGFDALPITTVWGLAFDLLARHGNPPSLLTGADQREEVARLLTAESPGRWPSAAQLVGRRAFAAEVAGAVVELQSSFLGDDEVLTRAGEAGQRARWVDLVAFAARYRAALAEQGLVDGAGLLVAAVRHLDSSVVGGPRFTHVLVDDAHRSVAATGQLVSRLAVQGAAITVASDPGATDPLADPWAGIAPEGASTVALTTPFVSPADRSLVICSHPSVEAEAVVGELLTAHDRGVDWSDMAVVVRAAHGARARSIGRAMARHGVPVSPATGAVDDEPVVRAILDVLQWIAGESAALERVVASPVAGLDPSEVRAVRREASMQGIPLEAHPRLAGLARLRGDLVALTAHSTPADLAFEVWRQRLGHLVDAGDDHSLDSLVTMLEALRRRAERRPGERLAEFLDRRGEQGRPGESWESDRNGPAPGPGGDEVALVSIAAAAGRHWHTTVVASCVEGELPRLNARPRYFDPVVLGDTRAEPDRRRWALADERRLFSLASSRASHRLVATAAPEPGVLLSRFIEGWPRAAVCLPLAPGPDPVAHVTTENPVPVFPDGQLRLSASRLSTYDDCPLRYAYEYGLGVRTEAGVYAALGSLVHEVLALFNDPVADEVVPHTREGLMALAEQRWRDDIARYRPQVEEARRDYFAMLDAWWNAEGGDERLAPEVLAVERRFEVAAGSHILTGFIDRIDRDDDGSGIRIVDYKTSKREPRPDDVADDIQLAIYHLAASRDPGLVALGPATQLRLLFVRSMHAFDQPVTDDHEAATAARVDAAA